MNQPPNPEIMDEYRRRRARQIGLTVPLIALIFMFAFYEKALAAWFPGMSEQALSIAMFAGVVGLMIFSFKNWRCPACSGYLGKAMNPKFCHGCGAQLHE